MIERTAPATTGVAKLGLSQVASGENPIEAIPTEAFLDLAKCRQINRFQSFISSFPSSGRFGSHRPLEILRDLLSRAGADNSCSFQSRRTILLWF
jgi:hypothetical protein